MRDADARWMRRMEWGERLGCHQMPERSFFIGGYQAPVCARCTGVIIASLAAIPAFFVRRTPLWLCIAMCGAMLADWLVQRTGVRESTNLRRLITGLLGGFGCMTAQLTALAYITGRVLR